MSFVKFDKGKCQILQLGRKKKKKKNAREANRLQSSFEEEDLEILVDKKLNMSW